VPFWTFFGATLIGKAIIKMHIQKLFVITAFNEELVALAVAKLANVPLLGSQLEAPLRDFLAKQKEKLHRIPVDAASSGDTASANVLSWVFEKFVLAMVAYFLLSILNSLAQSYHKRMHKAKKDK